MKQHNGRPGCINKTHPANIDALATANNNNTITTFSYFGTIEPTSTIDWNTPLSLSSTNARVLFMLKSGHDKCTHSECISMFLRSRTPTVSTQVTRISLCCCYDKQIPSRRIRHNVWQNNNKSPPMAMNGEACTLYTVRPNYVITAPAELHIK